MARRSRTKDPITAAATVVAYPWRVKSRFEAFIRPAARVVGALGIAMLAGCLLLWRTPAERWPAALAPSQLPAYVMVSLAVASLLGWAFVHDGQSRIAKAIGRSASLVAFVVVPISFAILSLVGPARVEALGGPAASHRMWLVAKWYGPAVVVASLVSFLGWKSRGRYARGAWFALLVAPYAALFAYLVVGVHVRAIDAAHHETIETLGSWAVALQLALGFFVGGPR